MRIVAFVPLLSSGLLLVLLPHISKVWRLFREDGCFVLYQKVAGAVYIRATLCFGTFECKPSSYIGARASPGLCQLAKGRAERVAA